MAENPSISKVKLPSGNVYEIKDKTARDAIAQLQGGSYFFGVTTTPITDGSTTNPITIGGESKTAVNGNIAIYNNREFIFDGTKWCEFGDLSTLGDLALLDVIDTDSEKVLGTNTTFTNASSAVTFSGGATDSVLGADTNFVVTQPTITLNPTTKYIHGSASGTAVGANGTANVLTGYSNPTVKNALGVNATFQTSITPTSKAISATASGTALATNTSKFVTDYANPTMENFVKSVSAVTGKSLVTTSITGCNGTVAVSEVTESHGKLDTTTVPNVTSIGSASTWSFTMGTGAEAETLVIGGANGTSGTLGTPITAATGSVTSNGSGSPVVTVVDITPKTAAQIASSATTVATGEATAQGQGTAIVTGVTVGESAAAITALGTATKADALTSASVSTQPVITLANTATAGTPGTVTLLESVTASTSVNSDDAAAAITALGTPNTETVLTGVKVTTQPTITLSQTTDNLAGNVEVIIAASPTASGTAVSADTNDLVAAVTNIGTATAAAQTITVTKDEVDALTRAEAVVDNS